MNGEYVNIGSSYIHSYVHSYIGLRNKLRNSVKGFINFKDNDSKCFLWCHIRHLNPLKTHLKK